MTTRIFNATIISKIIDAGTYQGFTDEEIQEYVDWQKQQAITEHETTVLENATNDKYLKELKETLAAHEQAMNMLQLTRDRTITRQVIERD